MRAGSLPQNARLWDLDLSAGELPEDRFDLVVTVMALHHIVEVREVLPTFFTLLADGGRLCIADLSRRTGHFHDSPDFHGHNGFNRDALSGELRQLGFTDVKEEGTFDVIKDGAVCPSFLATPLVKDDGY